MKKWIFLAFLFSVPALSDEVQLQDSSLNDVVMVRCESYNGGYNECRVGGRVSNAWMVQEHSKNACAFNQGWGFNRDRVWVHRGCRGTFRVELQNRRQPNDIEVTCSSDNYQYRNCYVGRQVYNGYVLAQHSNAACVQGRSWGLMQNGVWVDRGCRATFRLTIGDR